MSVKTILKTISIFIAAAILFGSSSVAAKAYDNSRDTSQTTASVQGDEEAENQTSRGADRPVFEDGEILLYCYEQLCLIGSGEPLTDSDYSPDSLGQGEKITDENDNQVRYTNDGDYRIACDIMLPRHTLWGLPTNFSGRFNSSASGSRKLYDDLTDTIYIFSAFQQAVMQADDASSQPVMSGDICGETFGTGTPIYRDSGGTALLTYSGEHNYAISVFYNPDVSQVPLSVRTRDSSPLRSGTSLYEGRDFAGQVIKTIDGKAYILIGNQDQLRAIGSDKDVFSPVYQTVLTIHGHELDLDNSGNPIMLYGGDADLLQSQNGNKTYGFQQIDNKENNAIKYYTGVNQNTGEPYLDATHVTLNKNSLTEASWRTGQKYSRDANYIIFRDIDLGGQNSPWKPLMFSGRMYGSKSSSGEKLWDGSGIGDSTEITELAAVNRPVISGVYVNQTGKLKINDYIGIGFFATISNLDSTETIGVSAGTSVVKNIELHDVHVENHSTETEVDQTLLNGVTSGLGVIAGTVLDALLSLLSLGSASTDLKTTLTNLLNARAQDPTIFAAGSFAGRIHGEVLIEDCLVSGTVTVSNVKDRTGGFAGYTEGMTEYSGLSTVLGVLTDGLAALLNVIPGVGLGDLITILLGNAIPVRSLIPTNYLVPEIRRCEVSGLTGTVGTDGTSFAGGFVGQQIGTRIENCSVKNSSVSVSAQNYGGGFAGSVFGAQIWGEDNSYEGCNVYGLRYVRSRIASGGYAGIISAAAVADVNTNASDGLLQRIIGTLVQSPDNLASLLQATITTIRQAEITPDNEAFGFCVGGFGDTYPLYAGGFGGSLEAAVINRRKGGPSIEVNGLRRVDGGLYAGGFAGLADVGSVASVSSSGEQSVSVLGLIQAGKTDLLDMFRTYIYDSEVNGIDEGFSVFAHSADSEGLLGETRYSGCAGGFAGGMMNGTIKTSSVTNLNTVSGLNYTGGFIGHAGKNGAVDVDDAAVSGLLGLTAGVLDIFGTVVDDCSVSGIEEGTVIEAEGGAAPDVGGFVGYADVSQIKNSHVTLLKRAVSAKTAGGFAGRTDMHYLIELEASSPLVQIVLKIVNALVKLLYVTDLENLGLVNLDSNLLGLKLLSDGDLLYVNLFGLRIGVSLVKSDTPGVTDTAKITIGDSSVELPCTEDGIDMNNENAEIALNLIKGNRTRIENSSVKGFVRGYDVYGGGADNKHDGTDPEGYAGGFVGYNNEGKLTGNTMIYCDTVSGSPLKTGPFSGTTSLLSVYSFNNILSIEGDGNSYSVYRESDPTLVNLKTSDNQTIGSAAVQDTETPINYNRYDIVYLASPIVSDDSEPYSSIFSKWEGAVMAPSSQQGEAESVPAEVYKSSSRAVLMLDTPTSGNKLSLTPEPAEEKATPTRLM